MDVLGQSLPPNTSLELSNKRKLDDAANTASLSFIQETTQKRLEQIKAHYQELSEAYISTRKDADGDSLRKFERLFEQITKYSHFRQLKTLRYGDVYHFNSIVATMEFDKDDEVLALAGTACKIKLYEYASLLDEPSIQFPYCEIPCRAKVSCLAWNPYIKAQLASSDYAGHVTVWDVNTVQSVISFDPHERRAWSVDFSRQDPRWLVSGSDDSKIKLWSTQQKSPAFTVDYAGSVCSVRFNPWMPNVFAAGGSGISLTLCVMWLDQTLHLYDVRQLNQPLCSMKGHRKAVSYVRFASKDKVVTTSTDGTLRLWDTAGKRCLRTFSGHKNDMNFIGCSLNAGQEAPLAGEEDMWPMNWIACGGEDNCAHVYHQSLPRPVMSFRFPSSLDPITASPCRLCDWV
jgi:E3 ubiquitin-protein ligase RFWD2